MDDNAVEDKRKSIPNVECFSLFWTVSRPLISRALNEYK